MRVRNKLLLDRWEALRRKSMSREGRVHTKLMQKQREEMQNLRDWMTEMEDRISQVFPSLAQLFQFASLLKKSLICLCSYERTLMRKNIVLLSCLPVTPLLWSLTLDWLFDVMRCLSRTLDSSHALLLELQRVKDTVSSVAIAAEVTGHCRKTTDANLDCVFVKEHSFYRVP